MSFRAKARSAEVAVRSLGMTHYFLAIFTAAATNAGDTDGGT